VGFISITEVFFLSLLPARKLPSFVKDRGKTVQMEQHNSRKKFYGVFTEL